MGVTEPEATDTHFCVLVSNLFISAHSTGTEMGVTEPEATFSACFGGAFLMWHPMKYAAMLAEKMKVGVMQSAVHERVSEPLHWSSPSQIAKVFPSKEVFLATSWRAVYIGTRDMLRLRVLGLVFTLRSVRCPSAWILLTVDSFSVGCSFSVISVNGCHELLKPHSYRCNID